MKKIIKLTESDLNKIIERILTEQGSMFGTAGTDIPGYRKGDVRNKSSQKVVTASSNINPKNLKLGDGGKNNPKQIEDVKKLQSELIRLGFLTLEKGPTGYFGNLTQKALDRYNESGTVVTATGKTEKPKPSFPEKGKTSQGGFILIFAFPAYRPSLEKGDDISDRYAKVVKNITGDEPEKFPPFGHGGCVVINSDGNSNLYEFGRYDGHKVGYGLVIGKNLGKIAVIKNGVLENPKEVAKIAKSKTQGEGPNMKMWVVYLKLPNPSAAISYAKVKERKYSINDWESHPGDEDANCGTFTLDVANAGGANVPRYCAPLPVALIQQIRVYGEDFFTV